MSKFLEKTAEALEMIDQYLAIEEIPEAKEASAVANNEEIKSLGTATDRKELEKKATPAKTVNEAWETFGKNITK